MIDQTRTDGAVARDDVQHAIGQTRLRRQLSEKVKRPAVIRVRV